MKKLAALGTSSTYLAGDQFNSIDTNGSVQIPILLIHGEADPKVPSCMSKELHEKASHPDEKHFFILENM